MLTGVLGEIQHFLSLYVSYGYDAGVMDNFIKQLVFMGIDGLGTNWIALAVQRRPRMNKPFAPARRHVGIHE